MKRVNCAAALAVFATVSLGQNYPARPVTITVPPILKAAQ